MTAWGICFDFPGVDDPLFAGWVDGYLAFTTSLKQAARFDDEAVAQRHLENNYGYESRSYGVVVEVAP